MLFGGFGVHFSVMWSSDTLDVLIAVCQNTLGSGREEGKKLCSDWQRLICKLASRDVSMSQRIFTVQDGRDGISAIGNNDTIPTIVYSRPRNVYQVVHNKRRGRPCKWKTLCSILLTPFRWHSGSGCSTRSLNRLFSTSMKHTL